jgi:hypothetical protein
MSEDPVADILRQLFTIASDHVTCEAVDGCDVTLCYCDADQRCPDTQEQGCRHREPLCGDHRLDCLECAIDHADDWEPA